MAVYTISKLLLPNITYPDLSDYSASNMPETACPVAAPVLPRSPSARAIDDNATAIGTSPSGRVDAKQPAAANMAAARGRQALGMSNATALLLRLLIVLLCATLLD